MNCQNITALSTREMQILKMIGEGYNSHEIAERTDLATATVCTHRKNILKKTQARNIISVVIFAVQERLIRIDTIAA